jgi:hypothetical protein
MLDLAEAEERVGLTMVPEQVLLWAADAFLFCFHCRLDFGEKRR